MDDEAVRLDAHNFLPPAGVTRLRVKVGNATTFSAFRPAHAEP